MATVAERLAAGLRDRTAATKDEKERVNPLRAGLLGGSTLAQFDEAPIERVQVDGTALLKIVRGGSGHLLGIDEKGTLLVSDAFALPGGSIFPAAERAPTDDRDRDASFRRKDDSFDAAFATAHAQASTYLPRLAELGADANVVGLFTTTTYAATTSANGQANAPSGALVEALVRYQLGGSVEGAASGTSAVKPKSTLGRPPRAPGAGVALVCDAASGQAAVGALSLKAYRVSDEYLAALKSGRLDAQACVCSATAVLTLQARRPRDHAAQRPARAAGDDHVQLAPRRRPRDLRRAAFVDPRVRDDRRFDPADPGAFAQDALHAGDLAHPPSPEPAHLVRGLGQRARQHAFPGSQVGQGACCGLRRHLRRGALRRDAISSTHACSLLRRSSMPCGRFARSSGSSVASQQVPLDFGSLLVSESSLRVARAAALG